MSNYGVLIPLFNFDYTGIIDNEKVWLEKYDVRYKPDNFYFFDENIVLKSFNIANDYPENDIGFFSPTEKRLME